MQRITVGILEGTKERVYLEEPYLNIPQASIIYYPEVSYDIVLELRKSPPKRIHDILSMTANLS